MRPRPPASESDSECRRKFTGNRLVDGRHALTAHLVVRLPGVQRALAEKLVRETERICPYTKLVRQGIESSVRVEIC